MHKNIKLLFNLILIFQIRYFLINESDRDKITIGGYIIFKTSNGEATYSTKQFKVLELEKSKYRVWHSRKNSPMAEVLATIVVNS